MTELSPDSKMAKLMERIRTNALGDRDLITVVLALCTRVDALEAALPSTPRSEPAALAQPVPEEGQA